MLSLHYQIMKEVDNPQPSAGSDVASILPQPAPSQNQEQPEQPEKSPEVDQKPEPLQKTETKPKPEDGKPVDQEKSTDPDHQGLIRTVKGAHLVYKRQEPDGTYEELWIYNVGKMQDELKTRKAILAGTDIPPTSKGSPDGKQTYDIWSIGNAETLHIKGLPN